MRLLVIGRHGQLARCLEERAGEHGGLSLGFAARPGCDLAEPGSAAATIVRERPALVVNAAAYTAVDRAEQEETLAHRINAEAAGEIAAAAAEVGAGLVHVSTDYVFDGSAERPWREDDAIAPLGAYGRTKAAGELAVRERNGDHLILRTAWVYSPFGQNFVKTMLRLAAEREEIAVVADQRGSPTNALDLAGLILTLAERRVGGDRDGWGRTYNAAGTGEASWAELAEEAMRASAAHGGPVARIRRIGTADFPTPARRPAWSVLDQGRLQEQFGLSLPQWRPSLEPLVARILAAG